MKTKYNKSLLALLSVPVTSVALVGCTTEERQDTNTEVIDVTENTDIALENTLSTYTDIDRGILFQYPSVWTYNDEVSSFIIGDEDADLNYSITPVFGENYEYTKENLEKTISKEDFFGEFEFIDEHVELIVDGKTVHEFSVKLTSTPTHYAYFAVFEQTDGSTLTFNHFSNSDKYFEDVKKVIRTVNYLDEITEKTKQ